MARAARDRAPFHHIHSGGRDYDAMVEHLQEKGVRLADNPNLDLRQYIYDMPTVLAAAHLVLCRAGAATLSELAAIAKPSILVPSPNVTADHQTKNARALETKGAAVVVPDAECRTKAMPRAVELLADRETLAALEQGENAMAEAVAEKNGQGCVTTATGGLTLWERDYGLPVREGASLEDRRAAVRAAMLGGRTLTPAFLKELCVTLGGGDRGEVEEDFAHWSVTALTVGEGRVPTDIPALKRAVERLKPAHLSVTVLPTADLTARRWEAVTGGVMMEVWG